MTRDEAFAEIIALHLGQLRRLLGLQILCGLLGDIRTTAKARLSGERVPEGLELYAEILTQEIAEAVAFNETLQAWVEEQEQLEEDSADLDGRDCHGQTDR
jgi:hypothetical protein